jgi:hypothetical protein
MKLLLLLLLIGWPAFPVTVLRMTAGGKGGIDAQGNTWIADANFKGGAAWTSANQANMATLPLEYRTLRYSAYPSGAPFSYGIPMANGSYTLVLKFAEPNKTAAGQRIFSVSVNGTIVINNLDLVVTAGTMKPYDVMIPVTAVNGMINLVFTPLTNTMNAVVSAIQIDNVPLKITKRTSCEIPVSTTSATVYSTWGCWNMEGVPYTVLSLRCASDAPNTIVEVMLPDYASTAVPKPLKRLGEAMVCNMPPEPVIPTPLSGVTYPDGDFLQIFIRVSEQAAGVSTARQVVVVAQMEFETGPAVNPVGPRLVALDTCTGSGPTWDCAQMLRARVARVDGSQLEMFGVTLPISPTVGLTWTPVK